MRLSNRVVSILQKVLFLTVAAILIITFLELTFIGKNITFSTRFTSQQSEENHVRNQTYITEAQALILLLCIILAFILPFSVYSAINQSKKIFLPSLLAVIATNAVLVFLNIYFLTGAKAYRKIMNQQYSNIVQNNSACLTGKTTLCMVGTCARLQVFQEATKMAISFTVINTIFTLLFTILAIIINKRRRDSQKLQLIV